MAINHSQELPQEQGWSANMEVPTFRQGNSLNNLIREAGFEPQDVKVDAFLLYSNDDVRMRMISGGALGSDQEPTSTEGSTRKTRLSFELHPTKFIEDFFLADDDDDSLYGNSDDINALASYLYGGDLQSNVIRVPRAADTNVRVPRTDDDISLEDAVKALNDDAHMNALGDDLERRSKVPRAA